MPSQKVADAYDALAADYDQLVEEDFWMRQLLWKRYLRLFPPGSQVLDVACGTGLDTLFLARAGMKAAGIDASAGMVEQLRTKAAHEGLAIEARVGDASDLSAWPDGSFDGIVSAFAGLNTVDLERFSAEADRVLRPGGRMVLHLLAPAGVWSLVRPLTRLRWREAWLTARRRELTTEIAGSSVHLTLLPPLETYERGFAGAFTLRRAWSLGFLWPRSANRWLPLPLRRLLGRIEPILGGLLLLRRAGRFFVLELEKSH
ncbi:MAG TPA: class I SAM-dependent methyltransferase [Thermoanaerobaculia bacterium]|nr:class I SAM-dependent methyltransferase [Thermoanaerobaculia bacterium]